MSKEQVPRTFKEPKSEKGPESKIILAEGVPTPISASPSFENTQGFFSTFSFPVDGKNPPRPFGHQGSNYEQWARNWEILGMHLGTDRVLDETGNKHHVTKERIRQIVEKLVSQSYKAAPAALRVAFPLESLSTKKPKSLHKSLRYSEAHGGKMREVIEAVHAGKSNEEIRTETGASSGALSYYRNRGVPVPYLVEALGNEYQENLHFIANGLLDDRQIIAIFEDIEKHNRYSVCYTLKKAGILVSLENAARSEGVFVHKNNPAAYRLLKETGIPVLRMDQRFTDKNGAQKTRSYFLVLNNHEKTKEAFAHPSFNAFRTNPVEVLGRMPEEIPKTSIMNDSRYIHIGRLLRERGIPVRADKVRKHLGPDCQVSVFIIPRKTKNASSLFVRKEDSDALALYLEAKIAS